MSKASTLQGRCVVGFGELLFRLATPGHKLIEQAKTLDMELGGAEANVVVGLAALGHETRFVSAVPANVLGRHARSILVSRGVDTDRVIDMPGRMGLYFLEPGQGMRASRITYDRIGSAFAQACAAEFDFDGALEGASLLHMSGITPALGPATCEAALVAAQAARTAGIAISIDCNYRESLWSQWNADPRAALLKLIGYADIVFGNHRDIAMLTDQPLAGSGPARRRAAAEHAFAMFPRLTLFASTAREALSADHNRLAARVDAREGASQTTAIDLSGIVDRIGAGDAFAAGVLHRWLGDRTDLEGMAGSGLALAALKHSLPGDMPLFDQAQLSQAGSGALDVLR